MKVLANFDIVGGLPNGSAQFMEACIDSQAFFVEWFVNANTSQALGASQVDAGDLADAVESWLTLFSPFDEDWKNQVRATWSLIPYGI